MRRGLVLAGYIGREALGVSFMALAVLVAISLALFLAELLGDLAEGEVLLSTLLELLFLRLPEAVLLTAPLALVIGLLMGFGELAQGEEFSIMRSGGLARGRVLRVVLGLAALWAAGLLLVSGWVSPWAEQRQAAIAERMADDLLLASIRPGQFQALGDGSLTVYARSADFDAATLEGVFVHFLGGDGVEAVAAARGRLYQRPDTGARVLSLRDGVHIGHRDGPDVLPMRRIEFERNDIELPIGGRDDRPDPKRQLYLPELLPGAPAGAGPELQRRLMAPIISIVLAVFALPITLSGARGRRFGVVLVAIVIYLVYNNAANLLLVRADGGADPGPGTWPLHAAAVLLALIPVVAWWRKW